MKIGRRMKELRKEEKMSQEKVARTIGIALRNYQRIETGKGFPSFHVLCALADHFQVSMDYLAGRTDVREMPPPPEDGPDD